MVRTRAFDPDVALTRAMDLFSARGYSDTSMDDIVKATGVSRYGLYGTFGNKRELFEQALDKFADAMGRASFMKLLEPDAPFSLVRAIFDERIEHMCTTGQARGCLISQTAMELAPHDHEIADVLKKFLGRMSKTFSIGLESAKSRGEVRADLDTAEAGEYLTGSLFGLAVIARAGFTRSQLDSFVDSVMSTLTP